MTTLREHLQRIIRTTACAFSSDETDTPECVETDGRNAACDWCAVRWDAVAALALLDAAEVQTWDEDSPESPTCTPHTYRLVLDPEPSA